LPAACVNSYVISRTGVPSEVDINIARLHTQLCSIRNTILACDFWFNQLCYSLRNKLSWIY